MARNTRWIGVALAVLAATLVVWALLRNPNQTSERAATSPVPRVTQTPRPPVSPTPSAGGVPQAVIKGTTVSSVDEKGRRQWELRATSVVVDSAAGTAALTAVAGTYFKEGKPAISFTAPRGTFFIVTRNVALSERVQARSVSGHTLEADLIRWVHKTQQIEASGAIVLRQRGLTIYADRLTADVALQRTRLEGRIRVTVAE